MASVWPFDSARNVEFMANEVPGMSVPETLLARMRGADSDAAAGAEGIRIAHELAARFREMAQGLHVAAPAGRLGGALAVLHGLP